MLISRTFCFAKPAIVLLLRFSFLKMSKPKHHLRQQVCATRAPYREGRKAKAVKVYTVNQESKYLVVQGVPAVGTSQELVRLFETHGVVEEHRLLDDYPSEQFTDVHLIKFEKSISARQAKRKLDDWSFYGGVLHVCYAPEYETVQETRDKLKERRMAIAAKVRQYSQDGTYSSSGNVPPSTTVKDTSTKSPVPGQSHFSQAPPPIAGPSHTILGHTHFGEGQAKSTQSYNQGHPHMTSHPGGNMQEGLNPTLTNSREISTITQGKQTEVHNQITPFNQHRQSNVGLRSNQEGISEQQNPNHLHSRDSCTPELQLKMNEEELQLPLPPKQISNRLNLHNPRQHAPKEMHNYEYANVRTAQAEFSPGFDARIGSETVKGSEIEDESTEVRDEMLKELEESQTMTELEAYKPKTIHEKIEENIKNKNVVVKTFEKKGPAPMFIPRQAMAKKPAVKKLSGAERSRVKKSGTCEVNSRLKRDAFTLKGVQGPAPLTDRPEVDPADVSVQKSVKEIRKHLHQVSSVQSPPLKKRKQSPS